MTDHQREVDEALAHQHSLSVIAAGMEPDTRKRTPCPKQRCGGYLTHDGRYAGGVVSCPEAPPNTLAFMAFANIDIYAEGICPLIRRCGEAVLREAEGGRGPQGEG